MAIRGKKTSHRWINHCKKENITDDVCIICPDGILVIHPKVHRYISGFGGIYRRHTIHKGQQVFSKESVELYRKGFQWYKQWRAKNDS